MAMKIKNVRFDQNDLERLDKLAAIHQKDVSTLIREVVTDYMDAEEWQLQQVEETISAVESGDMETISLEQFLKEER
ncbi:MULTISPECIES: CopG family ribbon-helix-helix protein [unclassified Endozoicomonas]|uniref:CopG family ribbon-helix-helix protein n=1 Tax=unclassified Endozoicomonas TaxID=2644528 RepID=UPI0021482F5B|nr:MULTISPECIES: ribbon-helix-helix domain-containing protein [unclassified Endozoicomonas]